MSDIDFQNGFICGMATRGLTKSLYSGIGPTVSVISAKNERLGALSTTWFTLEFSEPLQSFTSAENVEAFFVTGQKDWSLSVFKVVQVVAESSTKVAVQVEDFDKVDAYLNITYSSPNGTLRGVSGMDVPDTVVSILLQFQTPRIKARNTFIYAGSYAISPDLSNVIDAYALDIQAFISSETSETFNAAITFSIPSAPDIAATETITTAVLS